MTETRWCGNYAATCVQVGGSQAVTETPARQHNDDDDAGTLGQSLAATPPEDH